MIKDATARENILKLPDHCFSVCNTTGRVIKLCAGMSGFYDQSKYAYIQDKAKKMMTSEQIAQELNDELGITPAQREAMDAGSMWGWEVPGANVDNYNPDGSPKK
jgi:hypothetical protein